MNQDSLFSLEVVVDLLNIPAVSCRFPAIAFRLLDYPTLLIHHVDPDLADTIRRKLEMDSFYEIPAQFSELKDKQGNFPIKKGKSCLYKISAETLHMHLTNTPLYVMIIDTYPKVPKLLGSSTVTLQNTIDHVVADIKANGLSLPSVHGGKGTYRLYNLMGSEIGYITMGHRLFSLGYSLLSHIPEQAITKTQKQEIPEKEATDSKHKEDIVQTVDTIMTDLEIKGKNSNVVISEPDENRENKKPELLTQFTQTDAEKKSKQLQVKSINPDVDSLNDIFVNNIDCPPPLFYNSKAETGSSFKLLNDLYAKQDAYDNSSDETASGIESEISDLSLEEPVHDHTTYHRQTHTGEWKVRRTDPYDMTPQPLPSVDNFPLLNALFRELTNLQHQRSRPEPQKSKPQVTVVRHVPYDHVSPGKQPKTPLVRGISVPNLVTDVEPEPTDDYLIQQQPRSARHPHSHKTHRYHECEDPSHHKKKVPKDKGWLRQTPVYGQHKTKLKFGMTNTQRLRMARTNPEVLATMEKQLSSPRPKKKPVHHEHQGERREFAKVAETSTLVQGVPFEQEPEVVGTPQRPKVAETAEIQRSEKKHRKPVPTPRLSRDLTRESLFNSPAPSSRQSPVPASRKPLVTQTRVLTAVHGGDVVQSPDIPDSQYSLTTSSKRSIEVHIPQAGGEEEEYDKASQGTSDVSIVFSDDASQQGNVKPVYNPGFPEDDDDDINSVTSAKKQDGTQYSDYSEDFEDHGQKTDDEEYPDTVVENKKLFETEEEKSVGSNHSPKSVNSKQSQTSVRSKNSRESEKKSEHSQSSAASKLRIHPPLAPTLSSKSPVVAPRHSMQKRLLERSDSFDRDSSPEPQPRPRHTTVTSHRSPKSPSGSPGHRQSPRPPVSPSPPQSPRPRISRQPRVKRESVHTDSVSSYSPSDPDNMEFSMGTSMDTADGTLR
ncbi:microtubule-associated protein 10 [Lingula anatina]|uniref:Microtubule-associated protein 10 n=1 Tax=Lingula anatina TaxID=7574 RepID=A0A1S3H220_LINAN|nr:microtubule-associated protein 10 [Lingula anatina]|eukprot:XP_013379526.1 microtubule-associated protein 10 [Lingula anatina]